MLCKLIIPCLRPPPQVTLHGDHGAHSVHSGVGLSAGLDYTDIFLTYFRKGRFKKTIITIDTILFVKSGRLTETHPRARILVASLGGVDRARAGQAGPGGGRHDALAHLGAVAAPARLGAVRPL